MEEPRRLGWGGLATNALPSRVLPVPLPSQELTTVPQAGPSFSGRLRIKYRKPDPSSNGTAPVAATAAGLADDHV